MNEEEEEELIDNIVPLLRSSIKLLASLAWQNQYQFEQVSN